MVDYLWYRKNVNGSSANAYGYDNIDPWGRVCPDPDRWPSSKGGNGFKEVAQIVHKMGLKFGIHVMTGISVQAVDANTPILDVDTVCFLCFSCKLINVVIFRFCGFYHIYADLHVLWPNLDTVELKRILPNSLFALGM